MNSLSPALGRARLLALLVPVIALGTAYASQYLGGLYPCEMCWWQRYPHFVAIGLALIGFIAPPRKLWIALAALAVLVSGLIGGFHAGVEYGWWEGLTACGNAAAGAAGGDPLATVLNAPLVRCDEAQWSLLGISLAGWNFLISLAGAAAIGGLLRAPKKGLA